MSQNSSDKNGYTIITAIEIRGRRMVIGMSASEDDLIIYVDGEKLGSFIPFKSRKAWAARTIEPATDARLFGPIAKLARAKCHMRELVAAIHAFTQSQPYEFSADTDPKTGEKVFYGRASKPIPVEISAICGDIVHNLRSALDQLVCALVRANRKQVRNGNGFPIMGSEASFRDACVSKLRNTAPKVQQFIDRLKPYQGGNKLLWLLSELDNMDKHNELVPVAVERPEIAMQVGIPGMFLTPDGGLGIGGPAGSVPIGFQHGLLTPKGIRTIKLGDTKQEIMRLSDDWDYFPHNLNFIVEISFGKTSVTNNEPVVQTLEQLIYLVERILNIVERRIL